eukprot:Blabericola_migrator_1__11706@NODE_707_length_6783_cov_46_864800_g512_i0_p4_GENE_NODE_707_length_6783_cov_46_864800_g512_i0NODE_707_length_6783_cov_46_864800_g512_i0_p4_ORF_typecomplete_len173_score23_59zinc_ribbon_6/PF14599_6/0_058DUF1922/PF09082_10/5_5e03DUF1922/PF09082_10/0_74DUF1451/PF07295_11/3_8e03DUF1451/PF07295_11/0_28MTHFR_C/PF12225_8/1_2e02MTHFR_C/PF12225_8/1_3_NODE_707_length_6783_cov_46_864800_g512_i028743392
MLPHDIPVAQVRHEKKKRDRRHAYLPYTRQPNFLGGADEEERKLIQEKLEAAGHSNDDETAVQNATNWIPQKLVCLKRAKPAKGAFQDPVVQIHVSPSLNRSPFLAPASRKRKRQVAAVDALHSFLCQQCGQVVWLKYGDYYESCQRCGDCSLVPQTTVPDGWTPAEGGSWS